ncbi:MAG: glycosyltransferase [Candidatus Thorarchaeota archaeon]
MASIRVVLIGSEPEKMTRLRRTYSSLKKLGVNVSVFNPYDAPRGSPRLITGIVRYLLVMLQIAMTRADIYHIYNIPDIIGLPLVLKRGKIVYDVRSPWFSSIKESKFSGSNIFSKFAKLIEFLMTRASNLVLTANYPLAKRAYRWGARKVTMVPNFPPFDFGPTKDRSIMRETLGLGDNPVLLYLGKLSILEGSEILKEVILRTSETLPEVRYLIVGDGPERGSIELFLKSNKLEHKVRMMGWVSHDEVPNYISAADLCLFPRNWTTFSEYTAPENILKVGEYLALGKPVVAPKMGGFADAEFPVIAVEPKDMPSAVIEFFRNPRSVSDFERPSWDISHRRLEKIYRKLGAIDG